MSSSGTTLHIITPVNHPERVAKQICTHDSPSEETVVLDLSVGDLTSPSSLQMFVNRHENTWSNIRWIDGQQFATEVGVTSRKTYVDRKSVV